MATTNLNDVEKQTAVKALTDAIEARLEAIGKIRRAWVSEYNKNTGNSLDELKDSLPTNDRAISWATGYLQSLLLKETKAEREAREAELARKSALKIKADLETRFTASPEVIASISAFLPNTDATPSSTEETAETPAPTEENGDADGE